VNHENGFLNLDAFKLIGKDRKWIKAKLLEIAKALGMDSTGIPVSGEVESLPFDVSLRLRLIAVGCLGW
jgi:hypothetical protein